MLACGRERERVWVRASTGATDFPSQLAGQSSQLYANNVSALMLDFGAKGYFHVDMENVLHPEPQTLNPKPQP